MNHVPARLYIVTPAKAGAQGDRTSLALASRFRGHDGAFDE
jgi:hypothetical protein